MRVSGGLFSGAYIFLAANILNAAVPFLILPILTRYLEPSEYGQVAMFQTLIAALAAFTGLNAVGAANRKFFDDTRSEDMPDYIGACLQILFFSSVAVFLLLFLFKTALSNALGIPKLWVLMAALVSASLFIVRLRLGQWQVRKAPLKYGLMQVSMSLLNGGLSLVLVVVFLMGPIGRMMGETVAPVVTCAAALYLLRKDGLIRMNWRPKFLIDALRFGVPLIPHVGGIFLLSVIDRFFVNKHLGLDSAGVYMVAVQISLVMAICFSAFNNAYVPWLFERLKRNDPNEHQLIVRWTYGYFGVALLMASTAFVVGPAVIVFIAGEKFRRGGEVIGLLALGQALNGMYLMVTNYIFYAKKTGWLSSATITSGVFNVILLILLIPVFGLKGAAISFVLAMALRFFLTWALAQKCYPMPWMGSKASDH